MKKMFYVISIIICIQLNLNAQTCKYIEPKFEGIMLKFIITIIYLLINTALFSQGKYFPLEIGNYWIYDIKTKIEVVDVTTIKVPQDFPSIQTAINNSQNGDTVLVFPGTYFENINFKGKNIVLGSLFLTAGDTTFVSQTIIDGLQQGCVVTFENGENSTTILTGFTIRNGLGEEDSLSGGGITCINNSNPTLNNIIVKENSADNRNVESGGGILLMNSKIILNNSLITGNIARFGGGIFLENSSIDINNSTIKHNESRSNGKGGGICGYSSTIEIKESEIVNNKALFKPSSLTAFLSDGGGIYLRSCSTILENSNISYNLSENFGGGIALKNTNIKIYKTKITNNTAFNSNVYYGFDGNNGGGIYCENVDTCYLENVLIENNYASGNGGGIIYFPNNPIEAFKNVTIRNNASANGGGGIYTTPNLLFTNSSNNCSIYDNKAKESGNDIYIWTNNHPILPISINLDTVTISDPDDYHIYPINEIDISYKYALSQSVNLDLYVSPNGNNSNSGYSISEPLQTIDYALTVIKADSNNPKTINLLPGTYSSKSNGEKFPIYARSYVNLKGEDVTTTILDGETITNLIEIDNQKNIILEKLTIQNGYGENYKSGGVFINGYFSKNILLKKMIIKDNYSEKGTGGLHFSSAEAEIINLTIVKNKSNSSISSGGIGIVSTNSSIFNSIITDNLPFNIMNNKFHNILVGFSNIEGGFEGLTYPDSNYVNWLDGNIDSNPMFLGGEPFDYNLTENSPCVNSGKSFLIWEGDTLINLSDEEFIGVAPDMGAIESDFLISINEEEKLPTEFKLEQNYPNPFNPSTKIVYDIPKNIYVTLKIYNSIGKEVSELVNGYKQAGSYSETFDASNLPSGVYFYKLQAGEFISTNKMLLIK